MNADWKNIVGSIASRFLNIGIDKKDQFGKTPLNIAAYKNDLPQVEKLLSQGANVNARDSYQMSPLHLAAWKNIDDSHFAVAEALLKNGADPNIRNFEGKTPTCYLLWRGNARIVKLFLNFKADINVVDDLGHNLLFSVAESNKNWEVLQLLIDLGLNADHRGKDGRTPLHFACNNENLNVEILKCLLKNGANANAADIGGITPLIKLVQGAEKLEETLGVEKMKKNLNIITEYTDFYSIHDAHIFLTFYYKSILNYLWMTILEHIAKLEILGIPVRPAFLNTISSSGIYNDHYKLCQEELLRAKNTKLKNSWITYYNLLVDGRRKLKNYAGNKDLIEGFDKSECIEKFPTYGVCMIENLEKGIITRELYNNSSIFLSNCLPIFNSNHLIIRDTLDCILSKQDLSKFCV